jgi:inactivated superfamily I helicase
MRQHQLHVWITDEDHRFLASYAEERGETVGTTIRRLVRQLKRQSSQAAAAPFAGRADGPSQERPSN